MSFVPFFSLARGLILILDCYCPSSGLLLLLLFLALIVAVVLAPPLHRGSVLLGIPSCPFPCACFRTPFVPVIVKVPGCMLVAFFVSGPREVLL